MSSPSFCLKNLPALLNSGRESEEPAQTHGRGSPRTNPSEPPSLSRSRITEWARAAGRCLEAGDFAESLDGGQVESELSSIFRETPEFGRSLAVRLADFHQGDSEGGLTLIGGGGEAVVFFDSANQQVIKLLGENPTSAELADWMHQCGWRPFVPPTRHDMLASLTWRLADVIATDARPENAILAESDGQIYPFDFILGREK